MTQETLTAPSEPIEARVLNAVYLLLGVVFFVFLVWQQLDPDGPREWVERLRERAQERKRFERAIVDTLADIDALPELDDELDVDGFGYADAG